MNRLVYSALAIFCFAVVSCSQETTIPDCSQDQIVLNIFNSPMTKAAGDAGAEYGRVIGLMALLKEAGFDKVGLKTEPKMLTRKK